MAIAILVTGCQYAATGHNQSGVRLFQNGQQNAALLQFQQAIASNPRSADAHYNLAATLHRLGTQQFNRELHRQAEQSYNVCLDIDPNHADCYRGLAVLLVETDRSDRAFALLKHWTVISPTVGDARVELARLYEEFGDKDLAQVNLHQALQVDPNSSRAWAALGRLREQAGDYGQALANYQRSLQFNPSQPLIADRIASIQRTTGAAPGNRMVTLPSGAVGPGSYRY